MIRFVLDVHLAKLARHLRMLGFDSLWRDDSDDGELLKESIEEKRVLLTRDRELFERADPALRYYVQATDPEKQTVEVATWFDLKQTIASGKGFLTRCLQCNTSILPAQAHQLVDRLPGHVRLEFKEFFLCPRCERVYWKGSHFDRMQERVQKLLAELPEGPKRDQ